MAQSPHTRTEVRDRIETVLSAAAGVTVLDRLTDGGFPNGKDDGLILGRRISSTDRSSFFRGQPNETTGMVHRYRGKLFTRWQPLQREVARAAAEAKVDALQEACMGTADTEGIELWWVSDEENPPPSGEWLVTDFEIEAKCLFTLTSP